MVTFDPCTFWRFVPFLFNCSAFCQLSDEILHTLQPPYRRHYVRLYVEQKEEQEKARRRQQQATSSRLSELCVFHTFVMFYAVDIDQPFHLPPTMYPHS